MARRLINDDFIRDFFKMGDSPEEKEEAAEIRKKLVRMQFEHGQDIVTIDGDPDGMFFLESGAAIVLNREGEQINIMHEGQYFGEYAVLANQKRLSTVRSQGRTIVYKLSTEDSQEVLVKHPNIYGELMKKVYGQVSRKHSQILTLSRQRRGIMQDPANRAPLPPAKLWTQYGIVALIFILSIIFVPKLPPIASFIVPLAFMLIYVLYTRRTIESLIVSGMLASILLYKTSLSVSYADAIQATMASKDNVFTVLVMALMGGLVTIIEGSGAVTGFTMSVEKHVKTKKGTMLAALFVLFVTSIDDCLNLLASSTAIHGVSDKTRIPRERTGLIYSFLPTVLCSFIPLSLWGIFVIGTMNASISDSLLLFCKSIPFNFYSITVLITLLVFALYGKPRSTVIKEADKRVEEDGNLYPDGSERYLTADDPEIWGKRRNLVYPILVFVATSLALRSFASRGFAVDSACGLIATLIFTFFLYCAQGLMSPEQFTNHLIHGIQDVILPIVLYLLTMCFSAVLEQLSMEAYFDNLVSGIGTISPLLPVALFVISTLLTMALGSSWAMYAIAFPIGIRLCLATSVSLPLCIGAIAAAGIAGEKNCLFTPDAINVGSAIGCNPKVVRKVRMSYSISFTIFSAMIYLAAGLISYYTA
ncbi:MAG: cyclic nucleotide-binding domain-containing protein [Lachnospiraceae bacterium]|nr:cyclic nucleotide-binding domain-containing protein [Lachnospiraceae bacterium]